MSDDTRWHYGYGGRRFGPVSKAELERRVTTGDMPADALVWSKGMAEWVPATQVFPPPVTALADEPPPLPSSAALSQSVQPNHVQAPPTPKGHPAYAPAPPAPSMPASPQYYAPYTPALTQGSAAVQRPTSIRVFGILNMVFGSIGVLGYLFSALSLFGDAGIPIINLYGWGMYHFSIGSSIASFVLSVIQVVLGISLVKHKPWARSCSVTYGWVAIVVVLITASVSLAVYWSELQQSIDLGLTGWRTQEETISMIYAGVSGVTGLIYPALLIFFMRRSIVRDG